MKKIFYITLLFGFLTSCDEGLEEINENPNAPEFVLPNTIFNAATKEYTDFSRDDFNSGRLTLPWMQYWGQIAYADEDRYLYRETAAESLYRNSFLVAQDFKTIIDINTNPTTSIEASAVGSNNNQIAASRIMLAYIFHRLVDFFGDVPYYSYGNNNPDFQALDILNTQTPKFAQQEDIYLDILKELQEASDQIETNSPVFTSGDNIFGGNAVNWKKFANSLALRVANRLRQSSPTTANTEINAAIARGVFESNDDNAIQKYETSDATASPFWDAFINRNDFAVAAPFVNLLKGETGNFGLDARLFEMAAPTAASIPDIKDASYDRSENPSDYYGIPYAYTNANRLDFDSYSFPSATIITPAYGEVLLEFAEVSFILSEHNGWSQNEYETGVRASMERWNVATSVIDTFITSLPAATEETVLTQKYVALYMQPHESWAEYRRTGFPNTSVLLLPGETATLSTDQTTDSGDTDYEFISGGGLDDLPKRLRYPQILQTLNGSNRENAVKNLNNGDKVTSNIFWDIN